jgi:hypothetical protein
MNNLSETRSDKKFVDPDPKPQNFVAFVLTEGCSGLAVLVSRVSPSDTVRELVDEVSCVTVVVGDCLVLFTRTELMEGPRRFLPLLSLVSVEFFLFDSLDIDGPTDMLSLPTASGTCLVLFERTERSGPLKTDESFDPEDEGTLDSPLGLGACMAQF